MSVDVNPTRMSMLKAALAYATNGLPVFPLSPGTKKPFKGSRGFLDATTDPKQIEEWWKKTPGANIAIPTGKVSGWTVLDVDIKPWKDKHGDRTLEALTLQHGALPPTLTQKTWSGGRQYIFKYNPAVKQGAGTLGKDVDVRNDGGYIVVPSSIVAEDGHEGIYQWTVKFTTPLADTPGWMETKAAPIPRTTAAGPIPEGQRNDRLYRLGRSMRAKGMSEEAIVAALVEENAAHCKPPLPDPEVEAIAAEVLTQADRADFRSVSGPETEVREPEPEKPYTYTFESAFPPEHFVSQVIAHIGAQTDAAHEYAEATALFLLTAVTPRIRLRLPAYPLGLGTNLNILGIGASTTARKTTVQKRGQYLHQQSTAAPSILPTQMTPESLIEVMVTRDGRSASWYVDEWGSMLGKLHHATYMEGMKGWLLQMYDGSPIDYARRSKRVPKTGESKEDRDTVRKPCLSVYGLATPSLFRRLNLEDIESGLLPRFAIVMPDGKPPRRGLFESKGDEREREQRLVAWMNRIETWDNGLVRVVFEDAAQQGIDGYDAALEQRQAARADDDVSSRMYERLTPMLIKVAMLAAIGRPQPTTPLTVTEDDVRGALIVIARWEHFAGRFIRSLSTGELERLTERAVRLMKKRGTLPRKVVARDIHIEKQQLDRIEATLIDRGVIEVKTDLGIRTWVWLGES